MHGEGMLWHRILQQSTSGNDELFEELGKEKFGAVNKEIEKLRKELEGLLADRLVAMGAPVCV